MKKIDHLAPKIDPLPFVHKGVAYFPDERPPIRYLTWWVAPYYARPDDNA